LISLSAVTALQLPRKRPSLRRGTGSRCLFLTAWTHGKCFSPACSRHFSPAAEPPSSPVTAIKSPAWAPERRR
ncbi:hypothetical protein KKC1_33770, partial [Calderihabitans maritimus]